MEPDQQQHNCSATCVITQQYSSPTLSQCTLIPQTTILLVFQIFIIKILNFFFKLSKPEIVQLVITVEDCLIV